MAPHHKDKGTAQLELFELEPLFIVSWTNKNGQPRSSKYPIVLADCHGGDLEPQMFGLTTKFQKMQEATINNETNAIGNLLLADSAISAIKKDINQLRETLDMIEWCIEGNSNNVQLYVTDVIPSAQDVIKHFR